MWAVPTVIGITTYAEHVLWSERERISAALPWSYVTAVREAGGVAVLLPPGEDDPLAVLDAVDGIVLAGGGDIDPAEYGEAAHPATDEIRPDRDAQELALGRAALERDIPVLGICRGMQVLTVAAGGRLEQHLPDAVGHTDHSGKDGQYPRHAVRLDPDSLAGRLLGEAADVPSYHHQGVTSAGSLRVSGWAHDDTIEAVEAPAGSSLRFCLGVLWHPEQSEDRRLLRALVDAAGSKERRARPA